MVENEQGEVSSWLEHVIQNNSQEIPTTNQVVDDYFTLKEQAVFSNVFPDFGLHVVALKRLNRQAENKTQKELPIEEQEALLMYSLWAEDPVRAIGFAEEFYISERDVNQYVDDAQYRYCVNGEKLLDIVANLKRELPSQRDKAIQDGVQAVSIIDSTTISSSQENIVYTKPTATSADYSYSEEPPEPGSRAERYDHPILSRQQEYILVNYLKSGASLEQLLQDKSFQRIMLPEDTSRFARIFAQSKTVSDVLASCYFRLIDVVARGFHTDLPLDDRVNAGSIGLLKAAEKWDSAGAAKLSTYAVWDIRNAIHKAVQEDRSSIKIPEYVEQDLGQVRRLSEAFRYIFGRTPTTEELRQQLIANTELPISRIDNVLNVMQSGVRHVRSIHEKLTPDSEDEVADFIPDRDTDIEESVIQQIADEETRQEVKRAMAELLSPEEQRVIRALFGLDNEPEQTSWQIADAAGKPVTEIEHIKTRSLGKLSTDVGLQRMHKWEDDAPSFIYHMSAEDAAFRLGIFDTPEDRFEKRRRRLGLAGGIVFEAQPQTIGQIVPLQDIHENLVAIEDSTAAVEEGSKGSMSAKTYFTKIEGERSIIFRKDSAQVSQDMQEGKEDSDALTLSEQIKILRNQWFDNWQIASKLGIPVEEVTAYAAELIRAGEIESLSSGARSSDRKSVETFDGDRSNTLEKVRELRNDGVDTEIIASTLGISPGTVRTYSSILIRNGEIEPRLRGRPSQYGERAKERVKELREQGYDNRQISEVLDMPYSSVAAYASRLNRSGEITPQKKGSKTGADRRGGTVISNVKRLRNEGYRNDEISIILNASYGTVAVCAARLLRTGEITPLPKGKRPGKDNAEEEFDVPEEITLVRKYLEANPQPTYRDGFRRIFEARERRKGPYGRRPETIELDKQVKELLEQGLTRSKMAERLSVPITTIDSSVHRMIVLGEYAPSNAISSERVKKRWEYNETQRRVREMIEQGLNVMQIAEVLEDSLQHVQIIVWRLGKRGEISPTTEQLRPANRAGYVDKKGSVPKGKLGDVYAKVAEMRQQGLLNSQIAKELKLPVHRVEVYASNLIRAGVIEPQQQGGKKYSVGIVDPNFKIPQGKYYDKVAELRNQGLGNSQIAEQLKIPVNSVNNMATKLIRAGVVKPLRITTEERERLRGDVAELKKQGKTDKEMAEELKQPYERVRVISRELVQAGEIRPIKRDQRPKRSKREATASGDKTIDRVKELRDRGYKNQQIAQELDLPLSAVERYASDLIKAGEIAPLSRSKDRSTDTTYLKVKDLRNQGLMNKEIAERLHIPHATVSVIASKLIRAGEIKRQTLSSQDIGMLEAQIKELRGEGLSQQEIAATLNQPPWRVRKISSGLVKSGQVQTLKTGPKRRK